MADHSKLKEDLSKMIDEFDHILQDITDEGSKGAKAIEEDIREEIEKKIDEYQERFQGFKKNNQDYLQKIEDQTRKNPYEMVLGAFVFGLIVSFLINRK